MRSTWYNYISFVQKNRGNIMNNHDFGRLLKVARQQKQLTQEKMASELMVTVSAISKWENGKNLPDMEMIPKIAEILSISIEDLYHPNETLERLMGNDSGKSGDSGQGENATETQNIKVVERVTDKRIEISFSKRLRIVIVILVLLTISVGGILLHMRNHNSADSYITKVAFRTTEDEIVGTVYEVACVYSNIELDSITQTSEFVELLSYGWRTETSVPSEITIMKASFYESEERARKFDTPEKCIYIVR